MKKKSTTAVLALLFGIFGLHRFYLGERWKGFLHLGLFFMTFIASIEENVPIFFIPAILGFVDAILFFVKPKEEFDEKYNQKYLDYEPAPRVRRRRRNFATNTSRPSSREQRVEVAPINTFKESGMRKYDDFDIRGAITDFRKALNANFKDAQVHYLMACCYSINEEPEKSLFHLDKAVDFGFIDFDTIHNVDALAYLRTHQRFEEFVKNSYQIPRYLPEAQDEKLDQMSDEKAADLLDQIAELGKLYEKGVLTPEEFQKQKERLING
ncbi:MAG: NINE protein [Bacteroidota bacterium]